MDLSQIKKGLFSIKKIENNDEDLTIQNENQRENRTYAQLGFLEAGRNGGNCSSLSVNLHAIYHQFRESIKNDVARQEQLRMPIRIRLEGYRTDNENLERRIERSKSNNLARVAQRIEELRGELSHIRRNPQEITGDGAGKASFLIGGTILLFLTMYLFIFYSSASYSSFFKEFDVNEIGVANSIFDPKALSKSMKDGFTELALILTIPFVFIGLGYLIHKFQEQKNNYKYLKIAVLIIITFIFDSILAYEITEKIYNTLKENDLGGNKPDYTIAMAFKSVNFWLIIFAGFIVYIIWGFVFDFVMESYFKMDKVNVAIQEKQKDIRNAEVEQKRIEDQIDADLYTLDNNSKEINKLNREIEGYIVPREFEHSIFSFSQGWMSWMKQSGKTQNDLIEAKKITQEFVKNTTLL